MLASSLLQPHPLLRTEIKDLSGSLTQVRLKENSGPAEGKLDPGLNISEP
jgi:hypothetical protein